MIKKERRRARRIDAAIDVMDKEHNKALGTIKNLTSVGCFIAAETPLLKVGFITTICFKLPEAAEEIVTRGKVMWHKSEPSGIGMLFFAMNDKHFSMLEEFIDSIRT